MFLISRHAGLPAVMNYYEHSVEMEYSDLDQRWYPPRNF